MTDVILPVAIVTLLVIEGFLFGTKISRERLVDDCTTLNQTVINGQVIICKPLEHTRLTPM